MCDVLLSCLQIFCMFCMVYSMIYDVFVKNPFFAATIVLGVLLCVTVLFLFLKSKKVGQFEKERTLFETEKNFQQALCESQQKTISSLMSEKLDLIKENTQLKSDSQIKEKYLKEQIDFLQKNKEELTLKFQNISNEIIKAQNESFSQTQKSTLDILLKPFAEQLDVFKKKLEASHDDNIKFDAQIKNLYTLNQTLSQEAENLANALKGNKKIQGNWGEFQLERVLEISGLEAGINYVTQETLKDDNDKMFRPDVIVKLPDDRQVVIDSKVSLNDYVAFVNAPDEISRDQALKRHIACIKKHIDTLCSKEYQKLLKDKALDYVMIFIPIESAYVEAAKADLGLYDYAMSRNIAITTPSSLLPLLRTIENLWQLDKRNKNAAQLAEIGGKIYDKLAGFILDMKQIEKSLNTTHSHYQNAMIKLAGKGSVLSFAEQLKQKGAKTSKIIALETIEQDNQNNLIENLSKEIINDA